MKQIRRSVFETNSSSTHSLQIENNCTLENAFRIVEKRIAKCYENEFKHDEGIFDVDKYLVPTNNGHYVLKVTGLDFTSGEEDFCAYGIVKNWMAKIQYFAQLIKNFHCEFPEYVEFKQKMYEEKPILTSGEYNSREYKAALQYMWDHEPKPYSYKVYEWFKNCVIEWCSTHEKLMIDNVDIDLYYECYHDRGIFLDDHYDKSTKYLVEDDLFDEEHFKTTFNNIMLEGTILFYCDEAYSPYEKPKIDVF